MKKKTIKRNLKTPTGKVYDSLLYMSYSETEDIRKITENQPVWETLSTWESLSQGVLEKAGLPTDYKTVIEHEGGRGTVEYYVEKYKPLEPEYYAAKILSYIDLLRKHKENGDINAVIKQAMLLQQARDNLILSDLELDVRIGQSLRKTSGLSKKYSDEDKQNWETLANQYKKNFEKKNGKNLSIRKCAQHVESETGHGFESIRDHLTKIFSS